MGKLIVLEGTDGSGKGTQTELLAARLTADGRNPVMVSFPDYESGSSVPAQMYLSGEISENPDDVNPFAASSFYSIDRYISFQTKWGRLWREGGLILCNRYTTSNITHQMEKLPPAEWDGFIDWLCDFEFVRLGLPQPDLVIYLDMHESLCQELITKRYSGNNDKKDIHERNLDYLSHCRRAALCAAGRLGWQVVRCFEEDPLRPRPVEDIAAEVRALVDRLF